jgi:ribonuclease P protein component
LLARANRVTRPDDFRAAVRRGRRVPTGHTVLHVLHRGDGPARFGFIVTKAVGGAVTRNTVKRRLRAVGHSVLPSVAGGTDVVIRALPGSDEVPWATLHTEISDGLRLRDGSVAR